VLHGSRRLETDQVAARVETPIDVASRELICARRALGVGPLAKRLLHDLLSLRRRGGEQRGHDRGQQCGDQFLRSPFPSTLRK